ncbi:MAG: NAD(P)H-quinone oxidoreductase [Deltaproteobacteria bacterium]|nr:NAD(P)H-quinone oxidoreductase [Deltaproteobacteria bacterium]
MRAVVITRAGGPEVLELQDVPEPEPGPWDIKVAVRASALNRADVLQRRGLYAPPPGVPAAVPGLELAGVVEVVGAHVTRWRVGDEVMAIVGGGANADKVVLHEREALRAPRGLDLVRAAALPEAFMTAFDAAVLQGGLASGQWLAVNAVGSGVGTAAVQLARALGARVIGSARTPDKITRAEALVLAHGGDDLVAVARAAGVKASVLLDLVGGPGLAQALEVVRPQGTIVLVGLLGGAKAELPLGLVLQRRLRLVGTVLRSRPIEEKITLARAFEDRVVPLIESGALAPIVDRVLPLAAIADGHRALEAGETFGKVVIDHA